MEPIEPSADQFLDPEWDEWYRLTPQQRWAESQELWATYLALGGSLEPDADPQSPFYDQTMDQPKNLLGLADAQITRRWAAEVNRTTR
ncbi:MAG: hypothetical protein M3552_16155 [Planctomycetota bacterium]|nr:hypothetical protein [Planctomycetaceae bacterium]MDQ3332160.1 hypothetical protein [Planctomycetota bacterium]